MSLRPRPRCTHALPTWHRLLAVRVHEGASSLVLAQVVAVPWSQGHSARLGKSGWQIARDRQATIAAHGGVCHVCGKGGAEQLDHVVPLSQGGADEPSNWRPIHARPCHAAKTAAEARAGRGKKQRRVERHPGLR